MKAYRGMDVQIHINKCMYPLKFVKLFLKHPVYVINETNLPGYELGSRGDESRN
jgi:hypothetical protein